MDPTINVNTKPCPSQKWHDSRDLTPVCRGECAPVPIPCPIPRSVTIAVRLGGCTHGYTMLVDGRIPPCPIRTCVSHPIRVSCSIDGETWEESKLGGWELADRNHPPIPVALVLGICEQRWASLRALVTGRATTLEDVTSEPMSTLHMNGMLAQRDAVFAAITKVARMERAIFEAQGEYTSAMGEHHHPDWHRDPESYVMPSQKMLALYIERLIEQVGAMS